MVQNYSLTVTRPTRIGRMQAPQGLEATAALSNSNRLTQGMNEPGASQMIGYRFAAQQDADRAMADYNLANEEYSQSLAAMREEDWTRTQERDAAQRAHALRTAAINNPEGAAMVDQGLLSPEGYSLALDAARARVAALNRQGTSGGGSVPRGELTPSQWMAERRRIDDTFNAQMAGIARLRDNAIRDATRNPVFDDRGRAAQREAVAQANANYQEAVRRLTETRDAALQRFPEPPRGAGPTQGAPATTAPTSQTPAQPQAAAPTAPQLTPEQQTLVAQARAAIAARRDRATIERMLQERGINPSVLGAQ